MVANSHNTMHNVAKAQGLLDFLLAARSALFDKTCKTRLQMKQQLVAQTGTTFPKADQYLATVSLSEAVWEQMLKCLTEDWTTRVRKRHSITF